MDYTVAVTKKGQMTLPKKIREFFDIKTPDRVVLEIDRKNKAIKIEALPDIMELAGKFKAPKGKSALKSRQYFEKHYHRV